MGSYTKPFCCEDVPAGCSSGCCIGGEQRKGICAYEKLGGSVREMNGGNAEIPFENDWSKEYECVFGSGELLTPGEGAGGGNSDMYSSRDG